MIQKYTCVPISDYDVLIVTNGTVTQVETALQELQEQNEIPKNETLVYLDSFKDLVTHLTLDGFANPRTGMFLGKIIFMFFNGVDFVQQFLSECIDYFNELQNTYQKCGRLLNTYFYFDSTITRTGESVQFNDLAESHEFLTVTTIACDILKKLSFMTHRIRGLYINDKLLTGERLYAVRTLLANFPLVERLELSSGMPVLMNYLVHT